MVVDLGFQACTMPVIFVTVEEALGDLAQLKQGERVVATERMEWRLQHKRIESTLALHGQTARWLMKVTVRADENEVLIHAAAGGVGLVAIQYAKYVGAEIFATAGAEDGSGLRLLWSCCDFRTLTV